MSAVANPPRPAAEDRVAVGRAAPAPPGPAPGAPLALRLALFLGLGAYASLGLATLVAVDGAEGRVLLAVAVAGAGAFLLARSDGLELPGPAAAAARVGVVAATVLGGLIAIGVPSDLLRPGRLGALADGLERGVEGIRTVRWPYGGDELWVELAVLVPVPLALAAAAALCFWPARSGAGPRSAAGAAVLVGLFALAAVEHDPGNAVLRGLVLLVLLVAWASLGSLRPRDAGPALVAVGAAGVLASALALALDPPRPWVEYRTWAAADAAATFDWDHRYGPIDWPRTGSTLLQVRAPRPHYWKAESLDAFDGSGWRRSGAAALLAGRHEVPRTAERAWFERVEVTVRSLRTELLIGAGTTLGASGAGTSRRSPDGTTTLQGDPLEEGDSYRLAAYVPDPTPDRMRRAPATYPEEMRAYTTLVLPPQLTRGRAGALRTATSAGLRGDPRGLDPFVRRELLASPYATVHRLASRLAPAQLSTYDAVRSIERHLRTSYRYLEGPPPRRLPLVAFLTQDRAGYCQQFSGAMALMLRMRGIPARVATGFTPGAYDRDAREHRVRDTDAHSWVEVYFGGIGWVPFDPTPSASPAESQGDTAITGSAARGGLGDPGAEAPSRDGAGPELAGRSGDSAADRGDAASGPGSGRTALAALVTTALVLVAALVALPLALARRRRSTGLDPELGDLAAALDRRGWPTENGTTLAELERRFRTEARPGAARYVRALRERRFAPGAPAGPTPEQRRALRRDLGRRRALAEMWRTRTGRPRLPVRPT